MKIIHIRANARGADEDVRAPKRLRARKWRLRDSQKSFLNSPGHYLIIKVCFEKFEAKLNADWICLLKSGMLPRDVADDLGFSRQLFIDGSQKPLHWLAEQ
ncbi:MAG: hypothetical protein ACRD3W_01115, partial [Terriglobales bacterium]